MSAQFIHCSDGVDLVIDRTPRRFRRVGEALAAARVRALEMMAALPAQHDWSGWCAYVCDEAGEVARVPFEAALAEDALRKRIPRRPAPPSLSIVRDTGREAPARASFLGLRSLRGDRGTELRLVPEHR